MNKIYKVIFNRNKNRYEIVSELASSRGGKCKVKAGKQIAKLFMTGLLATFLSSVALAADEEVKVKYDTTTGMIKIVKATNESDVLATYAVGGKIAEITGNGTDNPANTIALGQNSTVLQSNTIAIGTDAHAGDASGSSTQQDGKIAIGNKTVASGDRSIALGNQSAENNGSYNIVQGRDSIGIGTSTSVFGYSGVSIGRRNIIGIPEPEKISSEGVLTTKSQNKSYGEADPGGNSVIVGAYNVAYGSRSSIVGSFSRAMGSNSVAIGSGVQSLSDGSIAIGKGSGYEFSNKITTYARYWELPPEYKVLKQVLKTDIQGDKEYKKGRKTLPKYENYGAGSSDPGGFIVEGKNALGVGSYTQVRGDSAIGLATGEMTADLSKKDKSDYAKDMGKIMDMEETLYAAKEKLKSDSTSDKETLEADVKAAEESLAAAKKAFREEYLKNYSFVEGEAALGVGRQILAKGARSMAVGDQAKAISNDAIAYGGKTLANGTNSMAMGGAAKVGTEKQNYDNSMAIGSHTNVQAGNAVALGAFSQVTGKNSLALGFGKQDGNNINYNAVSGEDSTLIGSYGTVQGNNSILIGSSGSIANDRVVALGNNINIAAADPKDQKNNTAGSVFLGDHAGYVKDSDLSRSLGEVDVVGSDKKMELTESLSSTKGALRDYTKDFIYIYMLERQDDGTQIGAPIAVRSDFAGGNSTVGVVSVGSTYQQNFDGPEDIKAYHEKVGSLITVPVDVTVQVWKNGIFIKEEQQTRYFAADLERKDIYADSTLLSDTDKEKVWNAIQSKTSTPNSTYTVFETRRIQNVAPGLIGSNSTDAINGSQLFATNQMLGNLVGSLKKALGDNVTITPDGEIDTKDEDNTPFTLGWIAKAGSVEDSNGTVDYKVDKAEGETEEANKEKVNKLKSTGYVVDAAKTMTFKAGKNIGLVQKPGELSISTVDMPSFTSVELRGNETTTDDGKKVTEVTKIDSSGMKVVTETSTPASDGGTTPTVTEKVSTTVGKDGVSTDGSVKVTNGKDGNQAKDLVTIGKNVDPNAPAGTDGENGTIGLDGKNGSSATITVDRGTSSLDDKKNIGGTDPAKMDRITYTTKDKENNDVTHEVATMDDGLFFSGDSADGVESNGVDANTFGRKLSQETKIVGGVDLGLQADATAEQRKAAIAAKLTDGNIGVISDGTDTLTVKLAKNLMGLDSTTYTSLTTKTDDGNATSTMKVDGNGVRFVGNNDTVKNDAPSLTTDGIDGGNKQITNIDSGLKNGNTTISISDLKDPNKTATINPILNNAVNVSDLKTIVDAGFKLNTSGQPTDPGATTVRIGDTINIIDGANTKVSAITAEDGTHTFHMDVNGLPMSYVTTDGKPVTKIGDKFYKTEDLENGTPKPNKQPLTDNEVSNNISLLDKTGNTTAAPQIKNVGSGLVNSNNKAMNPSDLLNTADNDPVLKNAVNAGDLKQVAAAVKTEVTGTGKAIVTNTTAQDGHTIYNVHVDPVVNVVAADGKTQVVRGDDGKYYDPADIENKTFVPDGKGGGNWYNTSDIGDNGQPNTGASVQNINPVDVKNNFVNPNGTGSIVVDNVKSGIGGEVKDPAHNNKNTFIDNVNKVGKTTPDGTATPDAISENTVVNAKDLKNLVDTGFKLNTSGQPADPGATTVKIGETIKVVDGTNTKVSAITTSKDGVHAFHIDVTGMPISYTDTDGNALTKIGDNYYKNTDITNGVPNKDAVAVDPEKVTDNIKVINKDGSTTNPGTISNVKSAIDGVVGNGGPNGSTINGEGGTNTFIDNVNRIGADTNGIDKNSVVTTGDLKNLADTPLFFSGDVSSATATNNTFSRKLSEKVSIVGEVKHGLADTASAEDKANAIRAKLSDGNIGVVSNGTDTLTIKLAKELQNLTSVTTGSGDNTTVMNQDGVTITTQTPKNGGKPASTTETKLSKDGLATDGTVKVTNGKTGDNAKDLVTIAKGTETDQNATDKEFGTVTIDGKNGSNAILTVDRGTKSVTDSANVGKDSSKPVSDDNQAGMDRLTYTTTGADGKSIINHEVATLDDGFFLTTEHTEADKTRTVLFNNTIKVLDGANTKVSAMGGEDGTHTFSIDVTGLPMTYTATDANGKTQDVHKVGDTYTLADGTKLVQVGDKFYKPDQVEEVNGKPQVKADQEDKDTKLNNVSLISPVANTAPTLSNVGSALKKSDGTRITMSDLDDSSTYPTDNPIWNNAVNVGDLKAATDAARTEVTGTGEAFVTSKQATDGHTIYNVHVDKILSHKDVAGNELVRGGDGKYYTNEEIKDKTYIPSENKWYSNRDITDGKPNKDAQAVTPNPVDQSNVKTSLVNPNTGVGTGTDTSMTLDNVKSGIGGEVKNADGNNTFIDNINKVGKKSDDGTAAPDAISENTVVNAKDLKNVVDTGFKLNTSGQGKNPADTVKIGDTIQVVDGKNTTVSAITNPTTGVHEFHIDVTGLPVTYTATEGKNGQPVDVSKVGDTYQLADGTKLVKYGDKFYKPNQIVNGQPVGDAQGFTINDDIRLVNPNNGTGPVKISNVAPGVGDNDAVNMSQLKNLSAGSKTEVTGTGAAEVTKKTAKDGHDIYNVHVDKLLTVKPVTTGTAMERGADGKYYAPSEIQDKTFVSDGNGGGSWYAKDDVDEYGTPLDGKSPLAQQPTALDPNTLKTSVTNPNGNGPTIVDNVKSVLDGSGIGNGADMSSKIDTIENGKPVETAGSNQFIKDLTGLNPTTDADKLNSVSTVSDLQKVALTPLFFEGDTAESATTNNAFGRKLSEKAKIVGGQKDVTKLTDNNIGVVSNGSDTLTVKLAKELQGLTSLTTIDETDGTKTIVSGKGVTTNGKVVVNNGKTGDEAKELVTIDKGTDGSGTDKEYGKIGLDGKNGSNATITIDRGTKSLNDDVNIGVDPSQPVGETNESAAMDRITYTTTGPNNTVINHEVATLDDGFFLTTSKDVTDNKAATKVKLNNTIKFTDGANTKVSTVDSKDGIHELHVDVTGLPVTYTASELDDNGKPTNTQNVSKVGDTYQLEDGTKLVKVDNKYYTPDQLENGTPKPGVKGLTIDNSIRVINPEQPNNSAKITNVAPGEADTDAVNMSQLKQQVAAATTEVTGTGAAEVTKVTGSNGQNIYNVHVDKLMTVKPVDANSTIARGGDGKYYNAGDIAGKTFVSDGHGGGNWYDANDVDQATGKPKIEDDGITPKQPLADQPQAVDQNTLKNSVVNPNGNGPTVLDNVKSGIGGDAGNGIKNGSTIDGTTGNNTFIENLDKVGKPANEGGIDKTTVVNAGDLKNLADTPLFFSGDSADGVVAADGTDKNTFSRKLSQETKIVGGVNLELQDGATAKQRKEAIAAKLTDGNIGVISDGTDTLTIKLAKELKDLASVKVSNGKDGKNLVTIGKEVDDKAPAGKDGENGFIGLDGKNGSEAVITIDRGTKSITDEANLGKDLSQPVSGTNKSANMDRITYTTKGANGDIDHEVATLDDGFMLTTSTDVANSKAPANVKLNNTIKFTDGANTKVSTVTSKDGVHELHVDVTGLPVTYTATKTDAQGNVVGNPVNVSKVGDTYQDAAGNKLIKVGDKYYRPDQLVDPNVPNPKVKDAEKANGLTITDSISLVNNDGTTNPTTLKNVDSGLKDANGNATTLEQAVGSNAVNVDDLRTIGKAATTEVTGTGAAEVTKTTGADGQNIYNVHVDKLMTVKPVDANTNIARGGDGKYYNASDIAGKTFVSDGQGGGSWYDANDVDQATGKPKTEDDGITPKQPLADQPQAVDQNMLKNSVVNPNGDGPTVLDNVKSGIGGKVVDPEHENKNTFMENVDTIGKANGISENTVVNAGDLKNLVDTGFKLNTSGHSGDAQTVKIGETIKVVDGANTKVSDITSKDGVHEFHIDVIGLPMTYTVSQTGDAGTSESVSKVGDTYQLADGTKLVKVGDKFYKPSQLVDPNAEQLEVKPEEVAKNWTVNDSISLVNKEGSKNAPTLKNVGSGLKDAAGNATSIDQAVGTNAVNVDDLRTIGKAATTEVTGTGAAEVTKVTGADGQNIYNVHVDKLMEAKSTEPGKTIVRGSDNKYYYVDDALKQANDGKWYPADQVGADGKPADGAVGKDTTELTVVPADKLKNSLVNPNGNGPTVLDNVKSGIGGKVVDPEHENKNTFMENVNTIGKANGISENTVVNAGDLKNLVDTGFKLNTSGHSGDAQTVKIGETIKVVDGANTKVSDITSKDGVHEFHIDVTGLPMTYTVSQTGNASTSESVSKVGDTYQLADGTKLVKVGNKFYKPSQLVDPNAEQLEVKPEEVAKDWTVNDSISLVNKEGSDKSPTLKNVGSGLKDANGNDTTLDKAVGSNAVNVDDLRTMGKAATTEITGTGAAEVTKVTGANGQNVYNVHVERFMQVAETDVEGNKVVKAADNHYYKEADIKNKTYIDGKWYNNTDIKDKTKIGDKWYNADDVVNGVPKPNATELTVQDTTPNKAVGLQNNLVNPNDNTPTRLSNLASALSGEVGNGADTEDNSAINGINKNGKPTSESGSNTFVKNVLDLDATVKTEEQLKTSLGHDPSEDEVKEEKARAEKDKALLNSAVTVADLQKTLQSPLFFEGDSADGVANENGSDKNTFARKLSQKTKIVGGVDLGLKENATADERKKAIAEKLSDGNIGVISDGTDTLTIKLAKDLTDLHSVTTTDDKGNTTQINGKGLATTADDGKGNIKITTVTSDGITIVTTDKDGNNSVSLTNKGLDNGHHQIINVKSGLLDRQGKPVTLKEASGDILNNAVNVKDLRDVVQGLTDSGKGGGFGLTGNNGEVHKSLGETITLKGGIANKVENGRDMNKPEKATTDKNTYIDVKTSKNGSEKIMVVEIAKDLTDLNSAEFTDQEGNTTKMKGDGIYIDKNGDGNADISLTSEGLNNGGNKITNVADGTEDTDAVNVSQLNKLKQEIKQNIGDEINELNAYAPVVYLDKEGNRVIRKGNKFVKKNDETAEIPPQDIRLSLVNADGKTTTPSTLQNVAEGVKDTDAVNVKQLKKPLTFNGDAGSSSAKLGETVAIKGGANSADLTDNNIGVIANSSTKTLNVKLSKKLKGLESAEFVDNNGNTTNITGDGVHISGGNGSNVSLTSQGLNNGGNRITNVAPGVEATDAVNVSQLNQVGAALHNRINNVAKGAYGGVASAGAMASLPQAYLPGKSMVAAGASHYRGESAVALGASRISDNGKIILKLNASHNTSGNTMVGAGVGYQF
ncbi:hypothetical protein P375_00865 [Gallibacterium genomosp. 2]|uniref:Uncharacterized protein n=1 Tax=Gallibacterium genomosp. 2 TaxID=155517 RepID=A0A0A2XQD7_9PAST|nr:YadA-like family protein [Gallibacterium genomosp. 2]KGQ34423.1 hypothetical protein P375_00865 [Gallibacterium genomosp. 2]